MDSAVTRNYGLFSDYYLDKLLPERGEWQKDYSDTRSDLIELLNDKRSILSTRNEAQTEDEFIQLALRLLGWKFETQLTFRRRDRNEIADYALFVSRHDKDAALASSAAAYSWQIKWVLIQYS
ncbi:MAG: hypothetical protein ACLFWL_05350 [Candidatus Brocadiia bacterium]